MKNVSVNTLIYNILFLTRTVKEKTSSVSTKEPEWFNKDVDINETTEEEVEELDMILKGLV